MRACILFALSVLAFPVHAQWAGWDYDFDREKKSWSELQAQLPPYPKSEELLQFDAGSATPHRFFIDPASLSIGEDQVVRYTIVVRTAGGATNVSFEGMRCETREQKTYAIGHGGDHTWSRARNPQWRRIEYHEVNRQYGVLYRDILCRGKMPAPSVQQIVNVLKYPPASPHYD